VVGCIVVTIAEDLDLYCERWRSVVWEFGDKRIK
jgi:hypothetical protein